MSLFRPEHLPRFMGGTTFSDRAIRDPKPAVTFMGHLGDVLADFPPRVLVCEDDTPLRMQLRSVFRGIGCCVDAPELSSNAFHEIETEDFDLVLMHFTQALVDADRVEFAPWARISTPFILFDDEDRRSEARRLGFEGFHRLPITPGDAQRILGHHVYGDLMKGLHSIG